MAQNGDNQPRSSGFFRNYPIRDINKCTERQNRYMKCLEEATDDVFAHETGSQWSPF